MTNLADDDAEFSAMKTVYDTLKGLDEDGRKRVLDYVVGRLGLLVSTATPKVSSKGQGTGGDTEQTANTTDPPFESFAELYAAVGPNTDADRALVAGYWLQMCQGAPSFDAQRANTELKHLGHAVGNITQALTSLKGQSPSLVIQLKKAGNSRQARKTYKVTAAGIESVKAKLNG